MNIFRLREFKTLEAKEDYYTSYDNLHDSLNEYYAHCVMLSLTKNRDLFNYYISAGKINVKRTMLMKIISNYEK